MKVFELYDGNANITLRLQEFVKGDEPFFEEDSRYDEICNKLEEGKGIAIYSKKNRSHMVTYTKPLKFNSLTAIKEKSNLEYKTPAYLPAGYTFKEGGICYEPGAVPSIKDMEKEAETTGKDLIIKDIEVTNNVTSITLEYLKGINILSVGISKWEGTDVYSHLENKVIEKTKVNGKDALYITETNSKQERVVLREEMQDSDHSWSVLKGDKVVEEKTKYYLEYSISSGNGDINKEELIKIAESLS